MYINISTSDTITSSVFNQLSTRFKITYRLNKSRCVPVATVIPFCIDCIVSTIQSHLPLAEQAVTQDMDVHTSTEVQCVHAKPVSQEKGQQWHTLIPPLLWWVCAVGWE